MSTRTGSLQRNWRPILGYLLIVIALTLTFSTAGSSVVATVRATNSEIVVNPGESIQAAINNASSGATITVAPGTYVETLLITKSVTLQGAGSTSTVIDGDGSDIPVMKIVASYVTVAGFTIQNTSGSSLLQVGGVQITNAVNVTVQDTTIQNCYFGIFLSQSNRCHVLGNLIQDSVYSSLRLSASSYNQFTGNDLVDNPIGIWITSDASQYNQFAHNNLIRNGIQVDVPIGYGTLWDAGYPAGGNYWSDHTFPDRLQGSAQNTTGSDGIIDIPYPDSISQWDYYPFAGPLYRFPWTTGDTIHWISVASNSTVSDFDFTPADKLLSFNVTGPPPSIGFCRAMIPKLLLDKNSTSPWQILVNGTATPYTEQDDALFTYLYFQYAHSTQNVKIIGAIPELSLPAILATLWLVTLLVSLVTKRARRQRLCSGTITRPRSH